MAASPCEQESVAVRLIGTPGIDVNAVDITGRTPLMVGHNRSSHIIDILARHPNIDLQQRDNEGRTPLMHACYLGQSPAVRSYLRLPEPQARDNLNATAMIYRARYPWGPYTDDDNLSSDFRLLAEAGIDMNAKDKNGWSALAHAVQCGRLDAIEALFELEGIDDTSRDNTGTTLLMIASSEGRDPAVCPHPSILRLPDNASPGKWKVIEGVLMLLLQRPNPSVNAQDDNGLTALQHAVVRGCLLTAAAIIHLFMNFEAAQISMTDKGQRGRRRITVYELGHTSVQVDLQLIPVPELAVRLKLEEHPDSPCWPLSTQFTAYASADCHNNWPISPSPWESRTLSDILFLPEGVERALKRMEMHGLGFPWERGWMAKGCDTLVQCLLNHPDVEDCGFGYLRNVWGDGEGSADLLASLKLSVDGEDVTKGD